MRRGDCRLSIVDCRFLIFEGDRRYKKYFRLQSGRMSIAPGFNPGWKYMQYITSLPPKKLDQGRKTGMGRVGVGKKNLQFLARLWRVYLDCTIYNLICDMRYLKGIHLRLGLRCTR